MLNRIVLLLPLVFAIPEFANAKTFGGASTPDFRSEMARRDALIQELVERVRLLEASSQKRSDALPRAQSLKQAVGKTATEPNISEYGPDSSRPPRIKKSNDKTTKPASKGLFEVDEDAAQRALERTLVITGALLVPYGQFEVQPGFTYQRYSAQASTLINPGNQFQVAGLSSHSDLLSGSSFFRLGLPWESQLEAYVPYQSVDRSLTLSGQQGVANYSETRASGFGDFKLGLAKTLLREKSWWPDVIARLTWDSDMGNLPNVIPVSSGFNELQGSLTLTKRQDPLVFFGTASYQYPFEENRQRPGNVLAFTVGTVLAASPETSLRFILNQNFVSAFERNGLRLAGTDFNSSTLNLGASTVLGKGFFMDLTAGVGLTRESPDYTVGTSFAYRLDLPWVPNI